MSAYPLVQDVRYAWLTLGLAVLGILLLLVAVAARQPALAGWGIALVGAEYASLFAFGEKTVDEATPVYAAGLILLAELVYWALEPRVPAWTEHGLFLIRLATIGAACFAAAVVAGLVIVVASASGGGGVAVDVLGVAAAVAALAVVAAMARSRPSGRAPAE